MNRRLSKFLDESKMAVSGILLATRMKQFWVGFILTFIIFGTLMNLLSGSLAGVDLFWATDLPGKMRILSAAFLGTFGVGKSFLDFLYTFLIVLLQSILIGVVVLVWRRKREETKLQQSAKNFTNATDAGLAAGLAVLGSGCPTCGTTLLAPLISAFASSGSYLIAGLVSGLFTVAAVLLVLFALKRVGREAYVYTLCSRYRSRHNSRKDT